MTKSLLATLLFFLCLGRVCAQDRDQTWLTPFIGDGYGVQIKEERTSETEFKKIKAAGLSYVRFVLPWDQVEKEKGSFNWGHFERVVRMLREHELKAIIILGGGNLLYDDGPKDMKGFPPTTSRALKGFANYAARTVEHFGGDDIVWEIWNEPDTDRFWSPHADVKAYVELADQTCRAVRRVAPDSHIIGPAMADMPGRWHINKQGFLGHVLASPVAECFDALSFHPYRDNETPPETVLEAYKKLRHFIGMHAPRDVKKFPILATEWGFTLTDVSEEEQAAYLLRSFLLNSLSGIPLSIWYEWRDAYNGPDDPEAHFGILNLDQSEKRAYRVLLSFLPPLKGARIEERLDTGNDDDFILLLRNGKGESFLAAWTLSKDKGVKVVIFGGKKSAEREIILTFMPQRVDLGVSALSLTARRVLKEKTND